MLTRLVLRYLFIFCCLGISSAIRADGVVVDKVYSPYVLPLEREIEWRWMSRNSDDRGNQLAQRLGFGHWLNESLTMEFYLLAERDIDDNFKLSGYELETRWMLTEQGQYAADWGLLIELEKQQNQNNWEFSTGLLVEKEFGKYSATANLFIIYEWGDTIANEWESEIRAKLRYRLKPAFQPMVELYIGEDYIGLGPALQGLYRFNGQKQLKYEFGFISELSNSVKDHTLRFALEYEY